METTKKYVWLVDTICRRQKIDFTELSNLWENSAINDTGQPLEKRTFFKWKNSIESLFGLQIGCDNQNGYKYFIKNLDDLKKNDSARWLLNSISVRNLIDENLSIKDRILLEDIPSNRNFLPTICDAIKHNYKLKIIHHSFSKTECSEYVVCPYCLKMYKQRWYVFGYSDKLRAFSLDRIESIEILFDESFELPSDFDAKEYFSKWYGVYLEDCEPQHIEILAHKFRANYIRTVPLHSTQKEEIRRDDYSIFSYCLPPTPDFKDAILAMGDCVEVIYPDSLRAEMSVIAEKTNANYDGLL